MTGTVLQQNRSTHYTFSIFQNFISISATTLNSPFSNCYVVINYTSLFQMNIERNVRRIRTSSPLFLNRLETLPDLLLQRTCCETRSDYTALEINVR